MANFSLKSGAFRSGDPIPAKYTCDGDGVSPPLAVDGVPEDAVSLALIVDDPDAPNKTFVHWVAYNIDPATSAFAEGQDVETEGANDFGNLGYGGPCPPAGSPHHYHFHLYALDSVLELERGATKKQVTQAMDGHVLAETELIGTYARSS